MFCNTLLTSFGKVILSRRQVLTGHIGPTSFCVKRRRINASSGFRIRLSMASKGVQVEDGEKVELVSLFPPRSPPLPPRIEHAIIQTPGLASSLVSQELGVSVDYIKELMEFGGVYFCEEAPPKPDFSTEGGGGSVGKKKRDRDQTEAEFQAQLIRMKPFRLLEDRQVEPGAYFRVHLHPKRFESVYSIDWKDRIVDDGLEWVVINKPGGISVNPTVDNLRENCAACTAKSLERPEALIVTHRLDVATSGVLVLAKTPAFARTFHKVLAARRVHKTYRTLTEKPVPVGLIKHKTKQAAYDGGPRYFHMYPVDSYSEGLECSLEVLKCSEIIPEHSVFPQVMFECEVRLITGRTHQIRAQFAALGAPIVGDSLYSAKEGTRRLAPGPGDSIGLQAWKLEIDDPVMGEAGRVFTAPNPWWRNP